MKWTTIGCMAMAAVVSGMIAVPVARADQITFTGSNGDLAASVTFETIAGKLVVTLANTSSADVRDNPSLLTGVFWDDTSNPTLSVTGGDAKLAPGSGVFLNDGTPYSWTYANSKGVATGDVGTEYAFRQGTLPGLTQDYGLSSAGFSVFAPGDRFVTNKPANVLEPPAEPDGPNFGLSSAGDIQSTYTNGLKTYIKNSVVMRLSGNATTVSGISNVRFQYGTSLTETHIDPVVPLPAAAWATFGMLGLLGVVRMRKARQ